MLRLCTECTQECIHMYLLYIFDTQNSDYLILTLIFKERAENLVKNYELAYT